jgi:signal transduction histidine kinase
MYPLSIIDIFNVIIEKQPTEAASFEGLRNNLLVFLGFIEFAFLGLVFVVCIFMSHKVAGPMYKLQNHLINIKNGGEVKPVFFRDGDNFQEVAEEVNEVLEYFVNQRQEDFAYLDEVSAYINNLSLVVPEDKKPVLNEIQSNLAKIQSRYQRD